MSQEQTTVDTSADAVERLAVPLSTGTQYVLGTSVLEQGKTLEAAAATLRALAQERAHLLALVKVEREATDLDDLREVANGLRADQLPESAGVVEGAADEIARLRAERAAGTMTEALLRDRWSKPMAGAVDKALLDAAIGGVGALVVNMDYAKRVPAAALWSGDLRARMRAWEHEVGGGLAGHEARAADLLEAGAARIERLEAALREADRLLRIARSGCDRTVRDRGSDVSLPHEVRMFALAFSPEGRDGPGALQVRGAGDVYRWFRQATEALGYGEGAATAGGLSDGESGAG